MTRSSPFVGRTADLVRLDQALRCHRLVTLLGPAGVGKSRLAHAYVRALTDPHVVAIDAASLADADAFHRALLRSAGGREDGSLALERLVANWSGRPDVLLVIDNVDSIAATVGRVAVELLSAVATLRVLVTSQIKLQAPFETGLDLVGVPDEAGRRIFEFCAARAAPAQVLDAALVNNIVRQVEGLPLSIELAAARLRYRTLHELATDPVEFSALFRAAIEPPARYRSLRAALDATWSRLPEALKQAALRLSVFAGGFLPRDAAALLSKELDDPEAAIDALRDHSLLWARASEDALRVGLFEAHRQFIAQQVRPEAHARWARLHAQHYAQQGRKLRQTRFDFAPAECRAWVAAEWANLDVAFERTEQTEPAIAADLAWAMAMRTAFVGPTAEHRSRLYAGLRAARSAGDGERQARVAAALAWSHVVRGEFHECAALADEATARAGDDSATRIDGEMLSLHARWRQGAVDGADARRRFEALERQAEARGWEWQVGFGRLQRALIRQPEDPKDAAEQAALLSGWATDRGFTRMAALADYTLGQSLRMAEQPQSALGPLRRASSAFRTLGEPTYVALAECEVATALVAIDDVAQALATIEAALDDARSRQESAAIGSLGLHYLELLELLNQGDGTIDEELEGALRRIQMPAVQARWAALLERRHARQSREVVVAADGQWMRVAGKRVDLSRRQAARRVLARLGQAYAHGEPPLIWEELYTAGWPDGEPEDDGARNRAYTVVWTLRTLGLEGHLERTGDGYRLRSVRVVAGGCDER